MRAGIAGILAAAALACTGCPADRTLEPGTKVGAPVSRGSRVGGTGIDGARRPTLPRPLPEREGSGASGTTGEWVDLTPGAALAGWRQLGGGAAYRVEGGELIGRTRPNQPNSFLCTVAEYADFELEFEFKVDRELNSGVQIRSSSIPNYKDGQVHGYQVEIDPSERAWTGGIYDEGRRGWLAPLDKNEAARKAFRQGEWNHVRVVARGDSIKTWLNSVSAAELKDTMTLRGFIGLQVHGVGGREEPLEVRWRGIRVREIPSAGESAPRP